MLNRCVLSRDRKTATEGAEVTRSSDPSRIKTLYVRLLLKSCCCHVHFEIKICVRKNVRLYSDETRGPLYLRLFISEHYCSVGFDDTDDQHHSGVAGVFQRTSTIKTVSSDLTATGSSALQ